MPLQLHPPQGILSFWSILWLLCCIGGSVYAVVSGVLSILLVTIPVGLLILGIWLRIKLCGQILFWLFVVYYVGFFPVLPFRGGISWQDYLRTGLGVYFAYLVRAWVKRFQTLIPD